MASIATQTFTEPHSYAQMIRAAQASRFTVLERRPFHARLARLALDRLWLQAGDESLARSVHLGIDGDRCPVMFVEDDPTPSIVQAGVEVSPDDLVFMSPATMHFQRTSGACRWRSMSLALSDLEEASALIADRAIEIPTTSRHVKPPAEKLARLRFLHRAAISMATSSPQLLGRPEVVSSIEQALVVAMMSCLLQGADLESGSRLRNRQRIMHRFEAWLEANPDRPVHLLDICAALGVPARTLKFCCHEFVGMGPTQYLRLRRMHLARHALQQANAETTVSEVATRFGFWELGRFAGAYRDLFGELPSATLAGRVKSRNLPQAWRL